jgi:hypothetical protein
MTPISISELTAYVANGSEPYWALIGAFGTALIAGFFLLLNEKVRRKSETERMADQLARAASIRLLEAVDGTYRLKKSGQASNFDDTEIQHGWAEVQIVCDAEIRSAASRYVKAYYNFEPRMRDGTVEILAEQARNQDEYRVRRSAYIEVLKEHFKPL